MRAVITSVFDVSAEKAWENARRSKTMFYICDGLISFKEHNLPDVFAAGSEAVCKIWFFNFLPGWQHHWKIRGIDPDLRTIDSEEYGGLVRKWHHLIKIDPVNDSQCRYTDEIDIEAGFFTPIVWMWASVFYRYRQRRWKKLIKYDFMID